MNINSFKSRMIGRWIAQSTNYGLLNGTHSLTNKFINQVKWTYIEKDNIYFNIIKKQIGEIYADTELSLYQVQSINNHRIHYILFVNNEFNQTVLLKLNEAFQLNNKFTVQEFSADYLSLTSQINNIHVLEKIYFLNNNVKLVKSIIKKHNKYIGTSFSSEIRIS